MRNTNAAVAPRLVRLTYLGAVGTQSIGPLVTNEVKLVAAARYPSRCLHNSLHIPQVNLACLHLTPSASRFKIHQLEEACK